MTNLFDRLGGRDAVQIAVDIFYQKVLSDLTLKPLFEGVDMVKQKAHQRAFMTYAFGGPNNYDGRNMRDAHKHLNLTEAHFQAVAGHLTATLDELNVPQELADEVMSIVASTHDDVLNL